MVFSYAFSTPIPKDLSLEQVWKGLQIKARNAVGFVPPIKHCEVISVNKANNSFVRRAEVETPTGAKEVMHEEVTEYYPTMFHFRTLENSSFVLNTVSQDVASGDLVLTFTFHWDTGAPAGSDEEKAIGSKMQEGFSKTNGLKMTLDKIQALVKEGVVA